MVAAFAALLDHPVRAHQREMLGYPWPGEAELLDQAIDVALTSSEFLDNPHPVGVREDFEDFR